MGTLAHIPVLAAPPVCRWWFGISRGVELVPERWTLLPEKP